MDALISAVTDGWSWRLGEPTEIFATNVFGNVIVKNKAGHYFRIMPEEWSCELIARSAVELEAKRKCAEFVHDWDMKQVVMMAERAQGPLEDGEVYYLVIPGILGGKYTEDNIRKISIHEVLAYCGDMAHQLEGARDGSHVKIVVK